MPKDSPWKAWCACAIALSSTALAQRASEITATSSNGSGVAAASAHSISYAYPTTQLVIANGQILVARHWSVTTSLDGGANWSPGLRVTNATGAETTDGTSIAASGSNVYLSWHESDLATMQSTARFDRSLDGGVTWDLLDLEIDALDPGFPVIDADGDHVVVGWSDAGRLVLRASQDAGSTWGPRRTVSEATASVDGAPRIEVRGNTIYAAWLDNRDPATRQVFFNRSDDLGVTWLATDTLLSTGHAGLPGCQVLDQDTVALAVDGTRVHAAWSEVVAATNTVFVRSSTDGGASWGSAQSPVTGSGASELPSIATKGSNVFLAWRDARSAITASGSEVYFSRSLDDGSTWEADQAISSAGAEAAGCSVPKLACVGDSVVAVWKYGIFNRSQDLGATWLATESNMNAVGAFVYPDTPEVVATESGVHAFWIDFNLVNFRVETNTIGGTPVRGGCSSWGAPIADRLASTTGFSLDNAATPAHCTGAPVLLVGTRAPVPLPVPTSIGCGTCDLMIGIVFGSFNGPLSVPPGVAPGFQFAVQSGCIANPSCVELSDVLIGVVGI